MSGNAQKPAKGRARKQVYVHPLVRIAIKENAARCDLSMEKFMHITLCNGMNRQDLLPAWADTPSGTSA